MEIAVLGVKYHDKITQDTMVIRPTKDESSPTQGDGRGVNGMLGVT